MSAACKYGDPSCPCQDGDSCHYEGNNPWTPPAVYDFALEVFRIAGGDVECCPHPTRDQAIACVRDLRERYEEALKTPPTATEPAQTGRGGADHHATLRKVLDMALDYARAELNWARDAYKGYEHRIDPYERDVKELEAIDAAMAKEKEG